MKVVIILQPYLLHFHIAVKLINWLFLGDVHFHAIFASVYVLRLRLAILNDSFHLLSVLLPSNERCCNHLTRHMVPFKPNAQLLHKILRTLKATPSRIHVELRLRTDVVHSTVYYRTKDQFSIDLGLLLFMENRSLASILKTKWSHIQSPFIGILARDATTSKGRHVNLC